jgi:hypothetical protein
MYLLIMSDSTTPTLAIVAIITAIGACGALLFKHIKKSDCLGVHIETRTPPETPNITLSAPPPSPVNNHKNNIEPIYKEVEV